MNDATNVQKQPTGQSLNRFARTKALDQIALTGKSLPCVVTSVRGSIVTVSFQITAVPGQQAITLPNVTIPLIGSEYARPPIQVGCKGMTVAADAVLGGMSGLGGGVATTALTGNLTALAFIPLGNVSFLAVNGQIYTIYGPGGVTLMDTAQTTFLNLTPGQIEMTAGGSSITINSTGVNVVGALTINGLVFGTHVHSGVQAGGSDTGGPVA